MELFRCSVCYLVIGTDDKGQQYEAPDDTNIEAVDDICDQCRDELTMPEEDLI